MEVTGTLGDKKAGIDYTHSGFPKNIGVCFCYGYDDATKVKTDYILFLNDDMYVLPFWDKVLYDEIEKLSDNYFFLSSYINTTTYTKRYQPS